MKFLGQVLLVAFVFFIFVIGIINLEYSYRNYSLAKLIIQKTDECEKNLPRNQTCKIIAVPR